MASADALQTFETTKRTVIVLKPKAEKFLGKELKGRKTDYYVLSEAGDRNLGGPYTKAQAKIRLRQVEYFKHNPEEENPRKKLYIKPNQAAIKAAKLGLKSRAAAPKSKKGGLSALEASKAGVGSGVMRARDIIAGKRVNAYQVKAFFDRHRSNYLNAKIKGLKPQESKAIQAWLLWGGEPLRKQVEAAVKKDRKKNPSKSVSPVDEESLNYAINRWGNGPFIRFGEWPEGEESEIFYAYGDTRYTHEPGISVYPSFWDDEKRRWGIDCSGQLSVCEENASSRFSASARPGSKIFLVEGDIVGVGVDWEPLIKNIRVTKKLSCKDIYVPGYGHYFDMPEECEDIQKNPSKSFDIKDHDWNQVLIQTDSKKVTRKQILDYYKKNQKKIWPYLNGQTVYVILGVGKNDFVLRRNGPNKKYIKLTKLKGIDDPHSFEYWIYRRAIEFHVVLDSKKTDLIWLDYDMHETHSKDQRHKLYLKMKASLPRVKKIFKKLGVIKSTTYTSGEDGGIHIEGVLKSPKNVDKIRLKLKDELDKEFVDDSIFTTGLAKSGEVRLDYTTLHYLGSLRAPYSFTKTGGVKKRL